MNSCSLPDERHYDVRRKDIQRAELKYLLLLLCRFPRRGSLKLLCCSELVVFEKKARLIKFLVLATDTGCLQVHSGQS